MAGGAVGDDLVAATAAANLPPASAPALVAGPAAADVVATIDEVVSPRGKGDSSSSSMNDPPCSGLISTSVSLDASLKLNNLDGPVSISPADLRKPVGDGGASVGRKPDKTSAE